MFRPSRPCPTHRNSTLNWRSVYAEFECNFTQDGNLWVNTQCESAKAATEEEAA